MEKYEYLQQKVEKWLVFAVIRQKILSIRFNPVSKKWTQTPAKIPLFSSHYNFFTFSYLYKKSSYLCKNTHLRKDAAFLHFPFKESSENRIFPWNGNIQRLTKIWSFRKTKILSFMQSYQHIKCAYQINILTVTSVQYYSY